MTTVNTADDLWFLMIFAEFMPKVKRFFPSETAAFDFLDEFFDKHFPDDLVQKRWPGYVEQVKDQSWHLIHIDGSICPAYRLFRENELPLEGNPADYIFRKKGPND